MAPIFLKEVIRYSSQDEVHRADNLLAQGSQWRRWLCSPNDKSGCIQAEFRLEKAVEINFIDVGNYGSAFIEVQVKGFSNPDGSWDTLIPATAYMSVMDSKNGKNKSGVKMFSKAKLKEKVRDQKWDCIKVICSQPYNRKQQFGLAFLRVSAGEEKTKQRPSEPFRPTALNVPYNAPPKHHPVIAPSWKTNNAFYRKYLETNKESSLVKRNNVLRMQNSVSAKTKATAPTETPKDDIMLFKVKAEKFLKSEGGQLQYATLKDLRSKFEERYGYALDKEMKEEFKKQTIRKVEKLVRNSENSRLVQAATTNNNHISQLGTVTPKAHEETANYTAIMNDKNPGAATTIRVKTVRKLFPSSEKQKYYEIGDNIDEDLTQPTWLNHSVSGPGKESNPKITSSNTQHKVCGTPKVWMSGSEVKGHPITSALRGDSLPKSSSALHCQTSTATSQVKGSSAAIHLRSCPFCQKYFTASQMNVHLLVCSGKPTVLTAVTNNVQPVTRKETCISKPVTLSTPSGQYSKPATISRLSDPYLLVQRGTNQTPVATARPQVVNAASVIKATPYPSENTPSTSSTTTLPKRRRKYGPVRVGRTPCYLDLTNYRPQFHEWYSGGDEDWGSGRRSNRWGAPYVVFSSDEESDYEPVEDSFVDASFYAPKRGQSGGFCLPWTKPGKRRGPPTARKPKKQKGSKKSKDWISVHVNSDNEFEVDGEGYPDVENIPPEPEDSKPLVVQDPEIFQKFGLDLTKEEEDESGRLPRKKGEDRYYGDDFLECPICHKEFSMTLIESHADSCAAEDARVLDEFLAWQCAVEEGSAPSVTLHEEILNYL